MSDAQCTIWSRQTAMTGLRRGGTFEELELYSQDEQDVNEHVPGATVPYDPDVKPDDAVRTSEADAQEVSETAGDEVDDPVDIVAMTGLVEEFDKIAIVTASWLLKLPTNRFTVPLREEIDKLAMKAVTFRRMIPDSLDFGPESNWQMQEMLGIGCADCMDLRADLARRVAHALKARTLKRKANGSDEAESSRAEDID